LNWKNPEDLPINLPEKLSHNIIHEDQSDDVVLKGSSAPLLPIDSDCLE
jgi:hypothetical protein